METTASDQIVGSSMEGMAESELDPAMDGSDLAETAIEGEPGSHNKEEGQRVTTVVTATTPDSKATGTVAQLR
ncbi:hypothetical protein M6B38_109870 [Iris pallida]|uniref:Uncharacterized protein n=1 Tax=Iris pallida TaxID=29817 RepID=A0AAX6E8E2_IRIPA|nr:hypothetical protein M6B38_109870 [Iris pallida]